MKKILLSCALAVVSVFTTQAQLVPNGDFETPIANGQLPQWIVASGLVSQVTSVTVNNAALVSPSGPKFVLLQNNTNVGIMQSVKFPLSTRPASLKFLACYVPKNTSSEAFGFLILMTKKNGSVTDTIMNSFFASNAGAKYPWVNFTADLATYYKTAATPDSAIVMFVTSVSSPTSGSILMLDDVKFSDHASGLKGLQSYFSSPVQVTPNPVASSSEINISYQLNSNSNVMVDLYDMQGRIVRSIPQESVTYGVYNKSMSVDGLPAGMYVCKVTANDQVQTTKIVITQ